MIFIYFIQKSLRLSMIIPYIVFRLLEFIFGLLRCICEAILLSWTIKEINYNLRKTNGPNKKK
jgi:hypothetical protein